MVRDAQSERLSRFPVYNSIPEALCYKCGKAFDDASAASGYADGHGEYVGNCKKCHCLTWFDVAPIGGKIWERTHSLIPQISR